MSPMMNEVCYNISIVLIILCLVYYVYNMVTSHYAGKRLGELKLRILNAQVDKLFEEAEERFGNPDIIDVDFTEGTVVHYATTKEMILDELSRQRLAPGPDSKLWKRRRQID